MKQLLTSCRSDLKQRLQLLEAFAKSGYELGHMYLELGRSWQCFTGPPERCACVRGPCRTTASRCFARA
jgi:hypothetical protein